MDQPASNSSNQTLPHNDSLTADDLKKLTSDLSAEIDKEIKKQLSSPHPFSEAQAKIDEAAAKVDSVKTPEEKSEPKNLDKIIQPDKPIVSSQLPEVDPELVNLDPLQASVNSALSNLHEGGQVGEGWIIKKIYSTSFGHNRSFFYELENKAGAKWTLSPEEMRDLLKSSVTGNPKPDLAPQPEKKDENQIQATKNGNEKVNEKKEATEVEDRETKHKSDDSELTKEQITFLSKIHSEPKLWQVFTSFNSEQISQVQQLYQNGQLLKFGIEAHPLLDKIDDKNLGKEVQIDKSSNVISLLQEAGHTLTYSRKDSILLGLHLLINAKVLAEAQKKAEAAGLVIAALPEPKQVVELIKEGVRGDNSAYQKILQLLSFLPTNSKLRILSTDQVKELEKHLTI